MAAQKNTDRLRLSYDHPVSGFCGIGIYSSAKGLDAGVRIPQDAGQNQSIIRGPQGSQIEFIRSRTGEPYEVTLTRQEIVPVYDFDPAMDIRFLPQSDSKCEPLAFAPVSPAIPVRLAHLRG